MGVRENERDGDVGVRQNKREGRKYKVADSVELWYCTVFLWFFATLSLSLAWRRWKKFYRTSPKALAGCWKLCSLAGGEHAFKCSVRRIRSTGSFYSSLRSLSLSLLSAFILSCLSSE